jgi:hypothetical protein
VTLNITVLTREMIYQSADYRLSVNGRRLDVHSTKATTLNFLDWTGFVTYTGIGRVGNKETSEFLCEWLVDPTAKSFEDIVELIRRDASRWINNVSPGSRHTFIVAAFVAGDPTAAVVSNFQTWHGANMAEVSKEFITSRVVATTGPEVIVTGVRKAVSRQQRRALCNFANKYATDPARVRRLLATTTRKAGQLHPDS